MSTIRRSGEAGGATLASAPRSRCRRRSVRWSRLSGATGSRASTRTGGAGRRAGAQAGIKSSTPFPPPGGSVTHAACAAAIAVLVTVAPVGLPGQQPIRVGVDLVNFGVVVTDRRGTPIPGLTKDDFEVFERGKPQQVQFFSAGDEAISPPLHLGFLLDASGSMDQDIRDVRTAAI